MQAATNEVVAASVMCLPAARLDRPMAAGRGAALRHFSVVRKLDGLPFPAGAPCPHVTVLCCCCPTCCPAGRPAPAEGRTGIQLDDRLHSPLSRARRSLVLFRHAATTLTPQASWSR